MNIKTILFTLIPILSFTQEQVDWHHLDPQNDSIMGVSTTRAYEYLKDKKADTVVVAILDNGSTLMHEDLQGTLWINPDEIEMNGIDDDKNGYIDDIHGWNFLGNQEGQNLKYDTKEYTRIYAKYHERFEGVNIDSLKPNCIKEFYFYQSAKLDYELERKKKSEEIEHYKNMLSRYQSSLDLLEAHFKGSDYSEKKLQKLKKATGELLNAQQFIIWMHDNNLSKSYFENGLKKEKNNFETRLNPEYVNRETIVRDDPNDFLDTIYGNNNIDAKGPYHGTGVASIIGAVHNDIGMEGISKHVKLMIIRIVPNGDERDKDVALAIKYAINEGADIINCSFAKMYSLHEDFVLNALQQAEDKGVLIVHAAGNSGTNNDSIPYYPTGYNYEMQKFTNWISVGASRPNDNENLPAYFSNYGFNSVDVFAPGYAIKTCGLNNTYSKASGTSIAAPVVSGIAAVLKSYYPYLTAAEIKEILIKSVTIPNVEFVNQPGNSNHQVAFKDLSVSGGIVNLYNAILLIESKYTNLKN